MRFSDLSILFLLACALSAQELPPPSLAPQGSIAMPCDSGHSAELAERARTALQENDPSMAAGLFRQSYEACPRQRLLLIEAANALTAARNFD